MVKMIGENTVYIVFLGLGPLVAFLGLHCVE